MAAEPLGPDHALLEELRRRRAELRESMDALELALAGPPGGGPDRWAERVHVALVELSADFREHVRLTEGPDGLYHQLLGSSPRLGGVVQRLVAEHGQIARQIDELAAGQDEDAGARDVDHVRDGATTLLGQLVRHRQAGSDLVYEAYQFDIGGET